MPYTPTDLSELLGSRICHDLISPLGAISNGIELLTMSGQPVSPEIELIAESIANANARVRFFRIAFGVAPDGHFIGKKEVVSILEDVCRGSKIDIRWEVEGKLGRSDVKAAFLAIQCLETALSYGGEITVSVISNVWQIQAKAEKLKIDVALWEQLKSGIASNGLAPAHIQFALLPAELSRQGRRPETMVTADTVTIRY